MTQNNSAPASKNSTARSKSSSKIVEAETISEPGKPEIKSRKVEPHKTNKLSNHISNTDEKESNKNNTINPTTKLSDANNKVNKELQNKPCK